MPFSPSISSDDSYPVWLYGINNDIYLIPKLFYLGYLSVIFNIDLSRSIQ